MSEARHFAPIRVLLPSEEVARRLADAVRAGFFRIGSRLPSERSLAEQLQVSRPTVREAVRLLVAANILTVRPGAGGGTYVISEIVPLDFIGDTPEMRPSKFGEALELRRLILPWVVQIASQYAGESDLEQMRAAIAFGRDALPRPSARKINQDHVHSVIIAAMRFDLALARATGNGLVVRLMDLLLHWVEAMRPQTLHVRADLALALALLEEMLAAVEGGDPAEIAEITEKRLVILERALEAQTGRRLRRRSAESMSLKR